METNGQTQPGAASPASALPPTGVERRRPGRPETVSLHLIPLLRDPAGHDQPPPPNTHARYDLAPLLGIVTGLCLSLPLWTVIAGIAWAIER